MRLSNFFIFYFLFLTCTLFGDVEEQINNGEDVTNPVTRLDFRLKYQNGVGSEKGKDTIFTIRMDKVFDFSCGWGGYIRIDAPTIWFYCPHHHTKTHCTPGKHFGDLLVQALAVTPTYHSWTFAFGAKFLFPTGGKNLEFGDGKYQVFPTVAVRYDLSSWMEGAYCGLTLRQANDFAGYQSDPHISQLYLQPFININLPDQWFLNSSPELFYDWIGRHWFIPFDLMVGKMITDKIVVSLEYEAGIVQDYPNFNQEIEFRIGYFF